MDNLKIDKTSLRTFKNYAKETGYTVQRIYQLVKDNKLNTVIVDGVKFIKVQPIDIFRSDSDGKSYNNERLNRVIANITKNKNTKKLLNSIYQINDHKGVLFIKVKPECDDLLIAKIMIAFNDQWVKENEFLVSIIKNDRVILDQ